MPSAVSNSMLVVVFPLLALAGCGAADTATYRVQGHVQSADGRRASFGVVELTAADGGRVASGVIGPDGSFQLSTFRDGDGAVAGHHRVIVVQIVNIQQIPLSEHHHELDVHPRYARYETSDLEFTVAPHHKNYLEITVDPAAP